MVAPAHAVENGARAGHRADGESRAQRFAEGGEVRLRCVVLLASAGRVAESGDHFVEDEQRAVFVGEVTEAACR